METRSSSAIKVGGLAVALGVGAAMFTGSGLAHADTGDSSAGSSDSASDSASTSTDSSSSYSSSSYSSSSDSSSTPDPTSSSPPSATDTDTPTTPTTSRAATRTPDKPRKQRGSAHIRAVRDTTPAADAPAASTARTAVSDTSAAASDDDSTTAQTSTTTTDFTAPLRAATDAILSSPLAVLTAQLPTAQPAAVADKARSVVSQLLTVTGLATPSDTPDSPAPPPIAAAMLAAARRELDTDALTQPATALQGLTGANPVAALVPTDLAATVLPGLPPLPSFKLWPTAFDPFTAVGYAYTMGTGLIAQTLSPFANGLPPLPAPTPESILAFLESEFNHPTPVLSYNPADNVQLNGPQGPLIFGKVGPASTEANPLKYRVIGRPLNGGEVLVNDDGEFVYRPMNAMAAVGGTDQFIVVVDDSEGGFHNHGFAGLAQFIPILGEVIAPGVGHRATQTIEVTVEPVEGVDLDFPDDFHWGVAYAGFQAEGGPGSPSDPNSDWFKWTHDPFNQLLGLTKGVPEDGPSAYANYEQDAIVARDQLGVDTFRTSIEWSRIFPNSTASVDISDEDGTVTLADLQALDALANQEEVEHYAKVFAAQRAAGLNPMVTVNHFTLPAWINDPVTARPFVQTGLPAARIGWLDEQTPVEFEKYAAYIAWKYGDQVDDYVVINEPVPPTTTQFLSPPIPGIPLPYWPPGVIRPDLTSQFLVNEATGHVNAYDAIHKWDDTASVGFANNMLPARAGNPLSSLDQKAADDWNGYFNVWFPNAVIDGWVDKNLDGIQTPDEYYPDFVGKADFIGVQYYGTGPMTGFGVSPVPGMPWLSGFPITCDPTASNCSDFAQPIDPGGFREVIETAASYGVPLWITENGIADAGDSKRPPYMANHIAVVQDMAANGTDIKGYIYWSYIDNLEWSSGYGLKFGLFEWDPTWTNPLPRIAKPNSVPLFNSITTANSLPLSVLQQYIPGAGG